MFVNLGCSQELFDTYKGWIVTFLISWMQLLNLLGKSLMNNKNACFFSFSFLFVFLITGRYSLSHIYFLNTTVTSVLSFSNLPPILPLFVISRQMMLKVKLEKSFRLVFAQTQMTLCLCWRRRSTSSPLECCYTHILSIMRKLVKI